MKRLLTIVSLSFAGIASAFYLNVGLSPQGAGSLNTSGGEHDPGDKVRLETWGHNGFVFKGWYDNDSLISESASCNYIMPARDATVTGRYEYDPSLPSDPSMPDTASYYSLKTILSPEHGGYVYINPSGTKFRQGEKIRVSAQTNQGFQFSGWEDEAGNILAQTSDYTFEMPASDKSVVAKFEYAPGLPPDPNPAVPSHSLTLTARPEWAGSFNIGQIGKYEEGQKLNIYAYANTGFIFKHWEDGEGNVAGSDTWLDFIIPAEDAALVAVYEYNPALPENPGRNHWDAMSGEAVIDDFTPGRLMDALSNAMSGASRDELTMLTVGGRMTSNDFGFANYYPSCVFADLSRATGFTEIPSFAFDYSSLETVMLPSSVEKIGDRAFSGCKNLSSVTCHSAVPPVLGYNVFENIPEGLVVYVPSMSVGDYAEAEGWKNFVILPIQEGIRSMTVYFPKSFVPSDYKGMRLELTNKKNGQHIHYILTDRTTYTFSNLIRNTVWDVTVKNGRGDVFGIIENVELDDSDVTVNFETLSQPMRATLSVTAPDGSDVTRGTDISWTDTDGNLIADGNSISGLPSGLTVRYSIALSKDLAMLYETPGQKELTLSDSGNEISCSLSEIKKVKVAAAVKDYATGLAMRGVSVSASQTFAGKYHRTVNARTDVDGNLLMEIPAVPTSFAFAAPGYVNQTQTCDSLSQNTGSVRLPDVMLKPITGATVSIGFTYTPCRDGASEAVRENGYSDYVNVGYSLFNMTKNRAITQYSVQYPQIVLLEEIEEGDILRITASSRNNAFMPVETSVKIHEQKGTVIFDVVELGRIMAKYDKSPNPTTVGALYKAGKLLESHDYSDGSLTISNIPDGEYTLLSMGKSKMYNNVTEIAQLAEAGLTEGTDYLVNRISVSSGNITDVNIKEIPRLDESKLYYTGSNTSFTANKPSIVAGNYLTLTGKVDFKAAYAPHVSNVSMIIDLPENCSFVENSVMVGNSQSGYTLEGRRITIPMNQYTARVRLCVIPTAGGEYFPTASIKFDLDGKTINQLIGSAGYTAKDLSISVPATVARTTIPVSGTAIGVSSVNIYDGNVLIGQTQSLKNGTWSTSCQLFEPTNLSTHLIRAEITTSDGLDLVSETKPCVYDKNAIEVNTVTMINTAHPANDLNLKEYVTVFDFQNPPESMKPYWYWPNYPDFTFIIDLTNNNPEIIKDMVLRVYTHDKKEVDLYPVYNKAKKKYVVSAKFYTSSLPANVGVGFNTATGESLDSDFILSCMPETVLKSSYEIIKDTDTEKSFLIKDQTGNPLFYHNIFLGKYSADEIARNLEKSGAESFIQENGVRIMTYNDNSSFWIKENGSSDRIDALIIPEELGIWNALFSSAPLRAPAEDPFKPEITDPLGWLRDAPLKKILEEARRKYPCASDEDKEMLQQAVRDLRKGVGCHGASAVANTVATTSSITSGDVYGSVSNGSSFGAGTDGLMRNNNFWRDYIHGLPECGDPDVIKSPCPDVGHIMDPSGFVYEAVESNRIEGVTSTIYYKETTEDMYGDIHEDIVKWDAEEYAQKNPLFTDENGMYAWDVPPGLWQVKFEKDGYETAFSEWLPVPPPQLDVNVGMESRVQPEVMKANAYGDAVEVAFDKYMNPMTLSETYIKVLVNDKPVAGSIELLDDEKSPQGEVFASKVRFNAEAPFESEDVTLFVSGMVKSYAGIRMQSDFTQSFRIEPEVKVIETDSIHRIAYGKSNPISVKVLPAAASAGRVLKAFPTSGLICTLECDSATIGSDGCATLSLYGELPGNTGLTIIVDGTDVSSSVMIKVLESLAEVEAPVADVESGTQVAKGTRIHLSTPTEGAEIYYTLDGSSPYATDGRYLYDDKEGIEINGATIIKALALLNGKDESEIAEFSYSVDESSVNIIESGRMNVYPLPLRDKLNAECDGLIIRTVTINDMQGHCLIYEQSGTDRAVVDVSSLAKGIYIITVETESGRRSIKAVK